MTAPRSSPAAGQHSWFDRYLLPGFAFKAVIIGGGYATGRELVEFFLPHGPVGGLLGMALATLLWSIIAALTFVIAVTYRTHDYRSFFAVLLGPGWVAYEIAYICFVTLLLAVFGAAAGAIGAALFGLPSIVGTLCLCLGIALFAAFGNPAVERLFKYVSFGLYGVYALFVVLALTHFGDRILANLRLPAIESNWAEGGITYTGYNIIGAVVILPVIRHLTTRKEAAIAGLIAGPLAMLPAVLFFVAMIAFYPEIGGAELPSDYLLVRMNSQLFHLAYQLMIFAALLESGTGAVHAINERVSGVWERRGRAPLGPRGRALLASLLLLACVFFAQRFGLVALIANGYRTLAMAFIAIYVVPLLTFGCWRAIRPGATVGNGGQSGQQGLAENREQISREASHD